MPYRLNAQLGILFQLKSPEDIYIYVENGKYVVLLYKYDVVEVGDLFVILLISNKLFSYKKALNIASQPVKVT